MGRRWILSLIVAIVAVSVVTGAASADFHGGMRGMHGNEVLERVATILGIEREDLDDAIEQARSEIHEEKQMSILVSLVENGTLTQDEADSITHWLNSRPDAVDGIKGPPKNIFKSQKHHLEQLDSNGALNIPSISSELLAKLVEHGKLSENDAYVIQEWLDARPIAVDKLAQKPTELLKGFAPYLRGNEPLELELFRKQLEPLREEFKKHRLQLDGNRQEDGFLPFKENGWGFEFKGRGSEFFFHVEPGSKDHNFENLGPFHNFTPQQTESINDPQSASL